ncbi:MAG: hypothetical protein AAGF45_10885 [Pseudomonadota bacterium]
MSNAPVLQTLQSLPNSGTRSNARLDTIKQHISYVRQRLGAAAHHVGGFAARMGLVVNEVGRTNQHSQAPARRVLMAVAG